MKYGVKVIKVGESEVPGPEVFWMSRWADWLPLHFYIVVLTAPGRTVLINTGPPEDLTELNAAWQEFAGPRALLRRTDAERPLNALAAAGIAAADVTDILITPLQAYATANIPRFPRARVHLSGRGWREDYLAPIWPMHVRPSLRVPTEVASHLRRLEAHGQLHLLEDEDVIAPGLRAWWAGTHHRSSMVYEVETLAGRVAVTDACFYYENVERLRPLGILESMAECFAAYDRLAREANLLLPLYDPEVLRRHPGGLVSPAGADV